MLTSIFSIKLDNKRSLIRIFLVPNQELNVLHHMNNLFPILINTFRSIAGVFSRMLQKLSSKVDPVLLLKLVEVILVIKGIVLT